MTKKKILAIIACYVAIIVFTIASVLTFGKTYTFYLNNPYNSDKITIEYSEEGVAENTAFQTENGISKFKFKGLKSGKTMVTATIYNSENENEHVGFLYELTVLPSGVLYLAGYDFGGYQFVVLSMALITLLSFVICFIQFKKRKKTQFFSHKTMLDLALIIFFCLQSLMYLGLFAACVVLTYRIDGWQVYNLAGFIMTLIFMLALPLIVIYAVFLSLSNLSLIFHEGFRKNNLFGI